MSIGVRKVSDGAKKVSDGAMKMLNGAMKVMEPSHTQHLLELGLNRLGPRRDLICKRFAERTARNSHH